MYLRLLIAMVLLMVMVSSHAESKTISSDQLEQKWQEFKKKFGKNYEDEAEEERRKQIFKEELDEIDAHNELYAKGLSSYSMGINQFADMEDSEYKATLTSFSIQHLLNTSGVKISSPPRISAFRTIPHAMNWLARGYVTPVKNQGQYGTCYAFSAVGALEGQWARRTNIIVPLSEQQIVDCGPYGTTGGWPSGVYDYIARAGGINYASYLPYYGPKYACRYNAYASRATCRSHHVYNPMTESQLRSLVASVGPVSVLINASPKSFHEYKGGVYDDPSCYGDKLSHAVLVVGYDRDPLSGKDYWIVKNSWGPQWGANGYIYMARNRNNQCGIASSVSYPIV